MGRELYFFAFTDNQSHGKSFCQKARLLLYQENQVLNFG
ncbi:hypothetical protein COO91_05430 [Nostoc flagelliforme CCNUN1]|uniref:Uncharacterized protein n=1 Tax=Nostoc flagelliforme CCNUN1 TaxID=2038116 RepID=A0A2K8SVD5_9NOSO|nr:hypothetical protein COO91_05430 [Nostoc flagelliforme CCNUN1]